MNPVAPPLVILALAPALALALAAGTGCASPPPGTRDADRDPTAELAEEARTDPSLAQGRPDASRPPSAWTSADGQPAAPGPPPDAGDTSVKAGASPLPIHGSLATRYRGRWTSDDSDHDLHSVLTLEAGDAQQNAWTGSVIAEAALDVDGNTGDTQSVFYSLNDTRDGALTARLYEAHADYHRSDTFETLRLGRQLLYETPEFLWFDGLRADTRETGGARWTFGGYGGIPVHLYESSSEGDALFGLFAQTRPWKDARLRVDWLHLEDENRLGPHDNDLFSLGAGQGFGTDLRLDAGYSRIEEEDRDVSLRATYAPAGGDLTLQASWYQLLRTQNNLALEADPFTTALLEQFPYRQARFLASKGFGEKLSLSGGFDLRRVSDESDIGQFNRDFDRWFATALISDTLPAALVLSLTGEVFDATGDDIESWGADLSRDWQRKLRASAGTYYSLYKYDLFQNEERDHVRTYYFRLRWKRTASIALDLRYEYEDDDTADFHTLRLGATWSF